MSESRDNMISAIKEIVVPTFRNMRFRGSFPHFRRERGEQFDLLTFQFSSWGGRFAAAAGIGSWFISIERKESSTQ
ncbi:DUF4304 domain-containing protein [Chthoniobacter flavus]|uniref:DUF4304 domain-containing protein n=1 Tax=Chthoniobacter flavus TaxID=191863 RepID=UPI0009FDF96E|nr:DUF4304 domain-containing protein [Chthoniobacter flavus]